MSTGALGSGLPIARFFGITIRVHWSWLLIFFLLAYSLATYLLPLSDMAGGDPWWEGNENLNRFTAYQARHPRASREEIAGVLGLRLWPEWQYWVLAAIGTAGLFVCVLAHELAHSVVAKAHGIGVAGITLFVFGGVSRLRDEATSPGAEFRVAAAGPLMSLAIGGVCGILYFVLGRGIPEQARALVFYFTFINIMLVVFNLLPGFPLDGGRLLRAVLWKLYGSIYRATAIAATFGKVLGAIFIGWGIFEVAFTLLGSGQFTIGPLWLVFIGLFLRNAAQAGYQQMAFREAFAGMTVGDILQPEVITVPPDLTLDRLVDEYFYRYRFRSFPVLEGGRLVGMVGLKDLQAISRADWPATPVRRAMHQVREANFVHPDDDLLSVFRKMMDADKGHLPVAQNDRLVGIVTRHDIMNLLQIKTDLAEGTGARR